MRRYRFFSPPATESGNAPPPLSLRFAEDGSVEVAAAGDGIIGGVLGIVSRHAWPAAIDRSRWMLLPLFQSEELGKLREDV